MLLQKKASQFMDSTCYWGNDDSAYEYKKPIENHWEKKYQKISKYGHFLRNASC